MEFFNDSHGRKLFLPVPNLDSKAYTVMNTKPMIPLYFDLNLLKFPKKISKLQSALKLVILNRFQ